MLFFGPQFRTGLGKTPWLVRAAVEVFLYRVAHGLPVTIWGDGSIIRD